MMRSDLFPYEIMSHDLELVIKYASLDRYEKTRIINYEISERSINHENYEVFLWAEEYDQWDFLSLDIEIKIPKAEVHKLQNQVDVIAAVNCRNTNFRQSFPLKKSNNSCKWSGSIRLAKNNFYATAELQCLLTCQALGRESRFFAESPLLKIYFDEAHSPPIHGAIPIKWINFKDTNVDPRLRKYANETHYLAVQDIAPTLYLNSGFEGLPELFSEDPKPRGFHLALYETVSSSIAKSVWLAMFQASLMGIRDHENNEECEWPEIAWQKDVLQQLIPHIYSDLSNEAGLQKAGNDVKSGEINQLESEALAVINKIIINEGKAVRKAIFHMQQ
jgi:hypothetical protein